MPLRQPSTKSFTPEQRQEEIDKICAGFVAQGQSLKDIYRALIECVFPSGAGVPGPVLTREDLRAAVYAVKPGYKDVFRRVRELQGEEGLRGLVKDRQQYQLQHLAISQKREPRKAIPQTLAREIALEQGSRCKVCNVPVAINGDRIDVDHRVPRLRNGTSHRSNLQVLCPTCNNAKSTQCSNCALSCNTCGWAFPETFRPVKLRPDIVLLLNQRAQDANQDVDDVTNAMLQKALQERP